MMIIEQMPLTRQLEMVFRTLKDELASLASGTIFVQIRNNLIGKFGVKHDPIAGNDGDLGRDTHGLSERHQQALRQMGLQSLQWKRWSHGEIVFEFALKNDSLMASVQFESNYNMNNLLGYSSFKGN